MTFDHYKVLAQKRLPKMFFDYIEGGSWDESGVRRNREAIDGIEVIHRVCVPWDNLSLETRIVTQKSSMPVYLSPCGLTGMLRANGEILAAKAAAEINIPYCYSMMSINDLTYIPNPPEWNKLWFQLYPLKDRKIMEWMIDQAKFKECSALVLTLDAPVIGTRMRDIQNGLSVPPRFKMKHISQVMSKPFWFMDQMSSDSYTYQFLSRALGGGTIPSLSSWVKTQADPTWDWDGVKWIRNIWSRKLILKGLLHIHDVASAFKIGADAVILSNHGARQLNFSSAPVDVLSEIARQFPKNEIMIDGGVQSGCDVARLLGLGATAVGIGRAYLYALAGSGQNGVSSFLSSMSHDLLSAQILAGIESRSRSLGEV